LVNLDEPERVPLVHKEPSTVYMRHPLYYGRRVNAHLMLTLGGDARVYNALFGVGYTVMPAETLDMCIRFIDFRFSWINEVIKRVGKT